VGDAVSTEHSKCPFPVVDGLVELAGAGERPCSRREQVWLEVVEVAGSNGDSFGLVECGERCVVPAGDPLASTSS
jgi:hypothetical protein